MRFMHVCESETAFVGVFVVYCSEILKIHLQFWRKLPMQMA